ncbi:MAG: tRNA pseudouridine(13) synthase TruD, partial [Planctomycetota bacterium]|nr:tRNA pseudouridine(13) synthase TruD [Planctomycetota bacterium]
LTGDSFAALPKPLRPSGTRRELRVPVSELKWSWAQDRAQLTFVLPAGSYATTLLEELNKQYV